MIDKSCMTGKKYYDSPADYATLYTWQKAKNFNASISYSYILLNLRINLYIRVLINRNVCLSTFNRSYMGNSII